MNSIKCRLEVLAKRFEDLDSATHILVIAVNGYEAGRRYFESIK